MNEAALKKLLEEWAQKHAVFRQRGPLSNPVRMSDEDVLDELLNIVIPEALWGQWNETPALVVETHSLRCWLGFHTPEWITPQDQDYFQLAKLYRCKRCGSLCDYEQT